MTRDDDLRVRPGRICSRDGGRAKPLVARALASAEKAGGLARRTPGSARTGAFGRGRAASLAAGRRLGTRSRSCTVKARVVRHGTRSAPLTAHLAYLCRDGVTRDGAAGRLFDAEREGVPAQVFAERCEGDRHHVRFIVSPEDGAELGDLPAFTRDLMREAARDLV